MGTWGNQSFENDWASDWLAELYERGGTAAIEMALQRVIQHGGTKHKRASLIERMLGRKRRTDWLTARDSARAIAAAEVVAAWKGSPARALPEQLRAWAESHRADFRSDMIAAAMGALEIITTSSELKDLHDGSEPNEWILNVHDLERRLLQ